MKAFILAPAQQKEQTIRVSAHNHAPKHTARDAKGFYIFIPCHTHLHTLPVSSALIALVFLLFKRTDILEDEVCLCCHGSHLPAVVPLSLRLVGWRPTLSIAQGNMDLPVFRQQLHTTGGIEEKKRIFQYVVTQDRHWELCKFIKVRT